MGKKHKRERQPPQALPAIKATSPPPMLLSEALGMGNMARRQKNYGAYMETLTTIPNVFAAASVIAYNFAAADVQWLDADDTVLDIRADIPALYTLLQRPSKRFRAFSFKELLAYDFLLTGNALVAMDSFTAAGQPTELFRLRPDWVRIVALSNGDVYYGYAAGGYRAIQQTTWYAEEEILHCRAANPLDDYWGLGVIEAGETTFDTDKLMAEFKRNYFDRGAILEGILTTDQVLTQQQSLDVQTMWRAQREGNRNRMKTAVLGQGSTYQPIQEPLGNIDLSKLSMMSKQDVFALFGVPLQLAGDFSTGNYHNSQQALSFFFQNTMTPVWKRFTEFWDDLGAVFGEYHTAYDDLVQDPDHLARAQTANQMAMTGAFKRNQILEAGGYPPLPADDPRGEEIICTAKDFQVIPDITVESMFAGAQTPQQILASGQVDDTTTDERLLPAETADTQEDSNNGNNSRKA